MWCRGYQRAGADRDGIPCENIRRSKSQVDKIKEEIGCRVSACILSFDRSRLCLCLFHIVPELSQP
jgi:hypothetical protein